MDKRFVVVDLDGTVFDIVHRVDYAKARQWDDFHSRLTFDKVYPDVKFFIEKMAINANIIACTGRPERWREPTIQMITKNGIIIDELLMRPDDDYRKDGELKIALLESFFGDKEKVLEHVAFCLEDRDHVVEAYRNYGLPAWQVRVGEY